MKNKSLLSVFFLLILFSSHGQIVINEIMVMPGTTYSSNPSVPGDNLNTDIQGMYNYSNGTYKGQEWIEFYNPSCSPVDIGCWVIQNNIMDGTTAEGAFVFPAGTIIPSGGFLVLGGPNAVGVTMPINTANLININSCDGSSSNVRWHLANGAGYLVLLDPNLLVVDAIYWDQSAAQLQTGGEYDNIDACMPYVATCNHPAIALPMAKTIPGIEYIGDCSSSTVGATFIGKTAYRMQNGGMTWGVGGTPTPGASNCPNCPPLSGSLSVQIAIDSATCGQNNGSLTASPIGGNAPYQYLWSTTPSQTTSTISNLSAGSYSVTVTDNTGCQGVDTAIVYNSNGLSASTDSTNASCGLANGSLTAHVTGGTPPYVYGWSSNPEQQTQTVTNIIAGVYYVTITDANGCSTTTSGTILDSGAIFIQTSSTPTHCNQSNGTATVSIPVDIQNATITWNTTPTQNTATIISLSSGSYSVTVDNGICPATSQVMVDNIAGPNAQILALPNVVSIENPNVIFVDQSTGTNISSWNWNFGDNQTSTIQSPNHNYTSTGIFNVSLVITDEFGCSDTTFTVIKVNDVFYLFIPNAFTPDFNSLNETFGPKGMGYDSEKYSMQIYNRWGEMIFNTNIFEKGWNGTKYNSGSKNEIIEGVYVYKILIADNNGKFHNYVGNVNVIR
ncbi:MAG: PKD domain-containing protein [Bacteroidota bacterium]